MIVRTAGVFEFPMLMRVPIIETSMLSVSMSTAFILRK